MDLVNKLRNIAPQGKEAVSKAWSEEARAAAAAARAGRGKGKDGGGKYKVHGGYSIQMGSGLDDLQFTRDVDGKEYSVDVKPKGDKIEVSVSVEAEFVPEETRIFNSVKESSAHIKARYGIDVRNPNYELDRGKKLRDQDKRREGKLQAKLRLTGYPKKLKEFKKE